MKLRSGRSLTGLSVRKLTTSRERSAAWTEVSSIWKECFPKLLHEKKTLLTYTWVLGVIAGKVVGAVLIDGNEIWNLCGAVPGKGIGNTLLVEAEKHVFRGRKHDTAVLFVDRKNTTDLVGYYQKRGYSLVKTRKSSKIYFKLAKRRSE
jgi:hypothetical protein